MRRFIICCCALIISGCFEQDARNIVGVWSMSDRDQAPIFVNKNGLTFMPKILDIKNTKKGILINETRQDLKLDNDSLVDINGNKVFALSQRMLVEYNNKNATYYVRLSPERYLDMKQEIIRINDEYKNNIIATEENEKNSQQMLQIREDVVSSQIIAYEACIDYRLSMDASRDINCSSAMPDDINRNAFINCVHKRDNSYNNSYMHRRPRQCDTIKNNAINETYITGLKLQAEELGIEFSVQ